MKNLLAPLLRPGLQSFRLKIRIGDGREDSFTGLTWSAQCDAAGRVWLHTSSSLRPQATARTPRRTGQGNCCWAISL